jgi:predicted dehydrogenase
VNPLGIGILGLHEGATLLKVLGPTSAGAVVPDPLERVPEARAVMACDLDPKKLEACRSLRPDVAYTLHYEEMLEHPQVEVVAIYTPDPLHAEHVLAAFEHGKHVICTKPLVTSLAQGRALLEAARRSGCKLLVGQSTRFFEPFLRQRRDFERGKFGEIELLEAHYLHRMDWYYRKSPWAAQADWAFLGLSHPLDLLAWYLPDVERVQAFASRSALAGEYGAGPDIYSVNALTRSGRVGRVLGHYGLHELPRARNSIELVLFGTAGTSLAQYHDMRYLYTDEEGVEVLEDALYAKRAYYFNNEVHGMHYGEFANYTRHFVRALREGTEHHPNLEDGLYALCLMEATRRSARQGGAPLALAPLLEEVGLAA